MTIPETVEDSAPVEDIADAGLALYEHIFAEAMARIAVLARRWWEPSDESDTDGLDAEHVMSTSPTAPIPARTEMAAA